MPLRVLIVDDSRHFLEAAQSLLECHGIDVVGVASTGADAIRRVGELSPDVTLIDVDLGDESGFDVARQVDGPVILISAYSADDLEDLIEASPAIGFLPKSSLSGRSIVAIVGSEGDRPPGP